jgi:hypothetical protein
MYCRPVPFCWRFPCLANTRCVEYQGGEWKLCYDSRVDCISCPSDFASKACDSCSCAAGEANFHALCDGHTHTLVLGHNVEGLNRSRFEPPYNSTFGGFAEGSWGGVGPDSTSTADFLFRLLPPDAVRYLSIGHGGDYQFRDPSFWPSWGHGGGALFFGGIDFSHRPYGVLGSSAQCIESSTYGSKTNEICGKGGGWSHTQMEVWYVCGVAGINCAETRV